MNKKIASIIVLTTSVSAEHTRRTIECVEKFTTKPYELFVLRDDRDHFGFSRDSNRLMRMAEGKYVILLNDDCFVNEGWLELMISAAESGQSVGLVGARLFRRDGRKYEYGEPFDFGSGPLSSVAQSIFRRLPLHTKYVTFALVLIKREVIEKIGYLDEAFTLGFEDNEYCLRAQNGGYKIVDSDVDVVHLTNTSSMSFRSVVRSMRGYVVFYRKLRWSVAKIFCVGIFWMTTYSRRFTNKGR